VPDLPDTSLSMVNGLRPGTGNPGLKASVRVTKQSSSEPHPIEVAIPLSQAGLGHNNFRQRGDEILPRSGKAVGIRKPTKLLEETSSHKALPSLPQDTTSSTTGTSIVDFANSTPKVRRALPDLPSEVVLSPAKSSSTESTSKSEFGVHQALPNILTDKETISETGTSRKLPDLPTEKALPPVVDSNSARKSSGSASEQPRALRRKDNMSVATDTYRAPYPSREELQLLRTPPSSLYLPNKASPLPNSVSPRGRSDSLQPIDSTVASTPPKNSDYDPYNYSGSDEKTTQGPGNASPLDEIRRRRSGKGMRMPTDLSLKKSNGATTKTLPGTNPLLVDGGDNTSRPLPALPPPEIPERKGLPSRPTKDSNGNWLSSEKQLPPIKVALPSRKPLPSSLEGQRTAVVEATVNPRVNEPSSSSEVEAHETTKPKALPRTPEVPVRRRPLRPVQLSDDSVPPQSKSQTSEETPAARDLHVQSQSTQDVDSPAMGNTKSKLDCKKSGSSSPLEPAKFSNRNGTSKSSPVRKEINTPGDDASTASSQAVTLDGVNEKDHSSAVVSPVDSNKGGQKRWQGISPTSNSSSTKEYPRLNTGSSLVSPSSKYVSPITPGSRDGLRNIHNNLMSPLSPNNLKSPQSASSSVPDRRPLVSQMASQSSLHPPSPTKNDSYADSFHSADERIRSPGAVDSPAAVRQHTLPLISPKNPIETRHSFGERLADITSPIALEKVHYAFTPAQQGCYIEHRGMKVSQIRAHATPCMACLRFDDKDAPRWKCTWCCLRICQSCQGLLRKSGGKLDGLLKALDAGARTTAEKGSEDMMHG
jgi:hypothetical protein